MTENYREQPTGPFKAGDKVQLSGPKGRLYTITLVEDGAFGTHRGDIRHNDVIGKPEGSVIANQFGVEYLALRPLLTDFVMSMPRGAAIIYPKDSAQIIVEADIFPVQGLLKQGWVREHFPCTSSERLDQAEGSTASNVVKNSQKSLGQT